LFVRSFFGHRAHAEEGRSKFSGQLSRDLAAIEAASGGRLGVGVLDVTSGERVAHRGDERFPMCSTFKVLAVSAVLAKVDAGKEQLDRVLHFEKSDLVTYSPITKDRVGAAGMTVGEICAAAIRYSDNSAANLILSSLGGPDAVTRFARSIGDQVTRLDRIETDLNEALPGDPRDTTSPVAMLADLKTLLLGSTLKTSSRDQLTQWMVANTTGDERLRAGVPAGWKVGDKTGSGERGTTNDVGIFWPPEGSPVLVTVYLTGSTGAGGQRSATIAAVGRAIASSMR
jgi:beta-lactamase class A